MDPASRQPPLLIIVGPTAGGKTALSIALANALPGTGAGEGECLCADSMQVYRGMDIGTAKPTAAERAQAPHHLLDLVDPSEDGFTVDRWLDLADATIADIRGRGRFPIVVGGTNLYIKALLEGMMDGPEPDASLRAELERTPLEDLRAELERIDPEAASRIHPNDRKRTQRAVEVFRLSGQPLSAQQQQWDRGAVREDARIIGLDYPVDLINRRINARVKAMIEAGLVEEVRALHEANALGRQAREALGYKQLIDHFEGRSTLEEAIEQIKIRTRRYAKQQRTWLRRFRGIRGWPKSIWLEADALSTAEQVERILRFLRETGDLPPLESSPT